MGKIVDEEGVAETQDQDDAQDLAKNEAFETLLKERQEYVRRIEQGLPALIAERTRLAVQLSKTARESIAAHEKQTRRAEDALLVDFAVGGRAPLAAGRFKVERSAVVGRWELWEDDRIIAVRVEDSPLNPVFLLDRGSSSATGLLCTQLNLFLKAYAMVSDYVIERVAHF